MKQTKYWLSLALMGWAGHSFAQSELDALRYSQTRFGGPARTQAIGGANTALGAELGAINSNPAGLGLFQKSEISFTPGYGNMNTTSTGLGQGASDSRGGFNITSLGVVSVNRKADSEQAAWRGGAFGIGLTRVNDFNTNFRYGGDINDERSLFQRLREPQQVGQSLGSTYDDIANQATNQRYFSLDGLAFGTYLTDFYPNRFGEDSLGTGPRRGTVTQTGGVQTTGSQTQYDLAYGASYRDKLYIGGGIGIMTTRYDETTILEERNSDPATGTTLALENRLSTRGTGINARIGAIYRASDYVRVGASVQTPTYIRMTDTYNASLATSFSPPIRFSDGTSVASASARTDAGTYDYAIVTPFRANGGVVVTVGKYGFLSGDLEYLNYGQARLRGVGADPVTGQSTRDDFTIENQIVSTTYRSTVNLRVGGEARYDIFRFRLGYARYGDPYRVNDFDRTRNYFTGGLGLRSNNFYLDLAGVYNTEESFYSRYQLNSGAQPVIAVDGTRFTTTATVGFVF